MSSVQVSPTELGEERSIGSVGGLDELHVAAWGVWVGDSAIEGAEDILVEEPDEDGPQLL